MAPRRAEDVIRAARQHQAKGGLSAVFVDYVQLLRGHRSQKGHEVLLDALQEFQIAARTDGVAYILVSQQKTADENKARDPRPSLDDMYGGAAMKQCAKLVLGLFRPEAWWEKPSEKNPDNYMYAKLMEKQDGFRGYYKEVVELWVLKNVIGSIKKCRFKRVDSETGRIQDFTDLMRKIRDGV
jgi:replicative DNA helicase